MLMPLPIKFDMNEWVAISNCLVLLIISIKLPKRLDSTVVLLIFIFNEFLVTSVDNILAMEPYDYYDWMDQPKFELFDIIMYYVLYPLFGYIFLYVYDRYRPKGARLLLNVVCWTIFSTFYEWTIVQTHVLVYKGWHLYASGPVYFVTFLANLAFYTKALPFVNAKNNGVTDH